MQKSIKRKGRHVTPDIRRFNFYQNQNPFTGSYKGINFRILPGEEFTVEIWEEALCSSLAQNKQTITFPFTEDGFAQLSDWLGERLGQRDHQE